MVILRGSPARVEDAKRVFRKQPITVYMRENRVIGENKPKAAGPPAGPARFQGKERQRIELGELVIVYGEGNG